MERKRYDTETIQKGTGAEREHHTFLVQTSREFETSDEGTSTTVSQSTSSETPSREPATNASW